MIDLRRGKRKRKSGGKMGGRHQGHYTVPTTMSHYNRKSKRK